MVAPAHFQQCSSTSNHHLEMLLCQHFRTADGGWWVVRKKTTTMAAATLLLSGALHSRTRILSGGLCKVARELLTELRSLDCVCCEEVCFCDGPRDATPPSRTHTRMRKSQFSGDRLLLNVCVFEGLSLFKEDVNEVPR